MSKSQTEAASAGEPAEGEWVEGGARSGPARSVMMMLGTERLLAHGFFRRTPQRSLGTCGRPPAGGLAFSLLRRTVPRLHNLRRLASAPLGEPGQDTI
ncbi:hypothetical protein DC522_21430 [Microvirga sp. KLBC 81]|nr:hypothetical protein DC522_21430 [Microvirga sp. KLBC 81]